LGLIGYQVLAQTPSMSLQDVPLTQGSKNVCVFNTKGILTPVEFKEPLTALQAIKEAGIDRAEVKNKIQIMARQDDGLITVREIDLKSIKEGSGSDPLLTQRTIIYVVPKKKSPAPSAELVYSACLKCGCRLMPGMHGPLLVP
jgi:hypothetical protein